MKQRDIDVFQKLAWIVWTLKIFKKLATGKMINSCSKDRGADFIDRSVGRT